jgi:hypothetical protein
MARRTDLATARSLRAVCISGLLLIAAAVTFAAVDNPSSPKANTTTPGIAAPAGVASRPSVPETGTRPLWSELSPAQQQALSPLAEEWNKLDSAHKKKWLEIGNKFSKMKPDEQQRVHARMSEWVKLSPDQRRIARESYSRAKRLNAEQKTAQWQQYQQLPEEQKKKLAADAARKRHVANLPSTHTKIKTVPPIKSTPKRVLEKSVTSQVAQQSSIQPSVQPTPAPVMPSAPALVPAPAPAPAPVSSPANNHIVY